MKRTTFRLAVIQMLVKGGCPDENCKRAVEKIHEASKNGAHVALLPEAMNLGWTHPSAKKLAEPIPDGKTCRTLSALAQKHKIYICAGLIERTPEGIYNSAVLIDKKGAVILLHRKLNELEIAHDLYRLGDRLGVVDTPLGRFGLMICADAFPRYQVISRTLGLMGADVILSPCAWAVPSDHDNEKEPYGKLWLDNYQPVARDFKLYIAGASNVGLIEQGPWAGRKCIGCSLVIAPDGSVLAKGPYGENAETILYVDITPQLRPAQGDGWERYFRQIHQQNQKQ